MEIIWKPYGDYLKSRIADFMKQHRIKDYTQLVQRSTSEIEWFWDAALKHLNIEWYKPYKKVLEGWLPNARWFIGGTTNIVHNCLDRHIRDGKSDVTAVIWEGDDGSVRSLTYGQLNGLVCRIANALHRQGIKKGDRIAIFMPMSLEMIAAFYAILKIGAVVVPVFSGFGAGALKTRLQDSEAKILFTADGGFRRGKTTPIKQSADEAVKEAPSVKKVVVLKHANLDVDTVKGRDIWFDDFIKNEPEIAKTEEMESEDYSIIIFTSGTTGRPKGTVHTHGGCLAQMVKEVGYAFDVRPGKVFFWFTDIGWMMGPWEFIGVNSFGGTFLIFEGTPDYPQPDRLWKTVARHKVDMLGISPTAIRLLISYGEEWTKNHDLSSLRLLGSTGEPWDEESYMWFFNKIGGGRIPIINISGGTEIVGCHLSPLPITELKPCTLRGPGLGMDVDVFDDDGKPIRGGVGHLVCKKPAPSMTRGFLNDYNRYIETYFTKFGEKIWYHGDWAHIDEDGFWFLHGRSDDTIKVAGKRVGPAEIEAVILEHPFCVEAAAIGVPDKIKGEAIVTFVVTKKDAKRDEKLKEELSKKITASLGKTMAPKEIIFVDALPKTRSAKIVRGAIKRKYLGEPIGDISSVENPTALDSIPTAEKKD